MKNVPGSAEPESLYELSWNYAEDSKFAFDANTGTLIDVNPAAETLMGCSRDELIGRHVTLLHPESERERVKVEFQKAAQKPSRHAGFHIQRPNGQCVPVMISSSKSVTVGPVSLLICVFRDITEQMEREHRLAAQNWALSAYAGAALALGKAESPEGLFQAICNAVATEPVYLLAMIGMAEYGPEKRIRIAASAGTAMGYLDGLHLSWSEDDPAGRGPTGVSIRTGKTQILEETETSLAFEPWLERARQFGINSGIAVPFNVDGGERGALIVYASRTNAFESMAIEVFENLADQIGRGVHAIDQERLLQAERAGRAKMEEQLTKALSAMVAPIVLAMEMRDPYTTGHQSRVADIAVAIGAEMGWEEQRLHGLRVAAQVHDIGKISIPAEILTKPGKLSAAELAMIQGHSDIGYTILKDIPFPWPVAEIVRQHHEKLDGSGYPKGLKADQLLPEAKVLAVADIVEAMASYRPYRAGIPLDTVLAQIESEAGTKLDEKIVRVCVTLFREKRLTVAGWLRR
jgi:PAS domain S-box-containing protein